MGTKRYPNWTPKTKKWHIETLEVGGQYLAFGVKIRSFSQIVKNYEQWQHGDMRFKCWTVDQGVYVERLR